MGYPAAIDVGANQIRFLQLGDSPAGPVIADIGLSDETLASLVKQKQLQGRVGVSLPLAEMEVFSFVLPNMPEKEVEQAIAWKIKQSLPPEVGLAAVSFDYACTSYFRDNNNKELWALVFSAQKEKLARWLDMFKQLNLEVSAAVPAPYAVFCALNFFKKISPEELVLALDLGQEESSATVVYGGHPCLIYPLSLYVEAAAPESLAAQVEQAFKFFSQQLLKSQVAGFDRIILCGEAAALNGLDKSLAERFSLPAEVFNPLEGMKINSGGQLSDEVKRNGCGFAAAAGVAASYLQ